MKPKISTATRKGSDSRTNEDALLSLPSQGFFAVLDGEGQGQAANGCAGKATRQIERLILADGPPVSLPGLVGLVKLLDAWIPGRATMAAVRAMEAPSGTVVLGAVVGDAKLAHFRDGKILFLSETRKGKLGSGCCEPETVMLRPERGDAILLASDGAWALWRKLLTGDPAEVLEREKQLLDDASVIRLVFV